MFVYDMNKCIDSNKLNQFVNKVSNSSWYQGNPGGFVTNSPKRQVNTYGDGSSYNNDCTPHNNGWPYTCWTAKMSQNNISLVSKPESLPQEFINIIPELRSLFKETYNDASITENTFVMCVCNLYSDPDHYIAAHTDDNTWYPSECSEGPVFASVTLYPNGEPEKLARFQIKRDNMWTDIELKHKSVMIMPSNIEHRVMKYKKCDIKYFKPRINITFRSIYSKEKDPLMNAMAVSNHTRYYGKPMKLIFPYTIDKQIKLDIKQAYIQFCNKYDISFKVKICKNDKGNYRRKYMAKYNKLGYNKFKITNNMVGELFKMIINNI
jgi:hypothetical protein